jgi:biopolymer transport protein TolQ
VWGIIKAFKDMSLSSAGGIDAVSVGISEALICTGAGLIVAIPAVAAYNWFVKRIDECIDDMELCSSEIMSLLPKAESR